MLEIFGGWPATDLDEGILILLLEDVGDARDDGGLGWSLGIRVQVLRVGRVKST